VGLSWPPRNQGSAGRADDELVERLNQADKMLAELADQVDALRADRDRLDWWLEQVAVAIRAERIPRVYRTRAAIDRARRATTR
jgi:hypothetical protein